MTDQKAKGGSLDARLRALGLTTSRELGELVTGGRLDPQEARLLAAGAALAERAHEAAALADVLADVLEGLALAIKEGPDALAAFAGRVVEHGRPEDTRALANFHAQVAGYAHDTHAHLRREVVRPSGAATSGTGLGPVPEAN